MRMCNGGMDASRMSYELVGRRNSRTTIFPSPVILLRLLLESSAFSTRFKVIVNSFKRKLVVWDLIFD